MAFAACELGRISIPNRAEEWTIEILKLQRALDKIPAAREGPFIFISPTAKRALYSTSCRRAAINAITLNVSSSWNPSWISLYVMFSSVCIIRRSYKRARSIDSTLSFSGGADPFRVAIQMFMKIIPRIFLGFSLFSCTSFVMHRRWRAMTSLGSWWIDIPLVPVVTDSNFSNRSKWRGRKFPYGLVTHPPCDSEYYFKCIQHLMSWCLQWCWSFCLENLSIQLVDNWWQFVVRKSVQIKFTMWDFECMTTWLQWWLRKQCILGEGNVSTVSIRFRENSVCRLRILPNMMVVEFSFRSVPYWSF